MAIEQYINAVIKVYATEEAAKTGGTTNMFGYEVTTGEVSRKASPTTVNPEFDYFIFREFWYRFEFNEPVSGFYIDWDDGDDNDPDSKANYKETNFKVPQTYGIASHIYTKNSKFFPIVRIKSVDGFWSKYYTTFNASNDYSSLDGNTLLLGQNFNSKVSLDKDDADDSYRLPWFTPHNLPPTAILKADRKRIFAGIDNDVIADSTADHKVYIECTTAGKNVIANNIDLEVEYVDDKGEIKESIWNTYTQRGAGSDSRVEVKKILSVKLTYLNSGDTDRLEGNERVYIRTHTTDYVVCCVSLGNPYITLDGAGYSVIVDASESLTKSSNVSIKNQANDASDGHYFDEGKYNFGHQAWGNGASSLSQASDTFNNTNIASTNSGLKQDSPLLRLQYTFNPFSISNTAIHYQDEYGRFFMEERMVRVEVEDNHVDNSGGSFHADTYRMSLLENWRREKYTTGEYVPSTLEHESCLLFYGKNHADSGSQTWHNLVHDTTYSSDVAHNSTADLCILRGGDEYLLMVQTRKFNKIYVAMRNESLAADTFRLHFRYPAKNKDNGKLYWKALAVVDNTAVDLTTGYYFSLMKSGTISFDMPEDWVRGIGSTTTGWFNSSWDGSPPRNDSTAVDPDELWNFEGYALMMTIGNVLDGEDRSALIQYVFPCDNTHSTIINVEDPHHISLNNIAVAQDVSWNRKGKFYSVNDRLGRSEVRRLGIEGGSISLGGVQLNDSATATKPSFKLIKEYQQRAVPVYYDVERNNGEFIRFYGKITNMDESVPTGKKVGRWTVTMQLAHVVEFTSNGTWITSSLVGLGGEIEDEPKYLL